MPVRVAPVPGPGQPVLARTGEGATAAAAGSKIQQGHPAGWLSCWSVVLYTQKQVVGLSPGQVSGWIPRWVRTGGYRSMFFSL